MRQFAMHLARTVERTVDVDGMLECMTPSQFAEWHAYYRLCPWGDDWMQTGTIASSLHNDILLVSSGLGGSKVDEKELTEPADYIPKIRKAEQSQKKKMSTQEMYVWFRMQAGV